MDFAPQVVVLCVAHDTDDFVARVRWVIRFWRPSTKSLPERVLRIRIFFDECLIHNYRSGRGCRSSPGVGGGQLKIRGVEGAAGEKRNVQGLEKIRPDAKRIGGGHLIF